MFSSQRNENVGDERSLKHPESACAQPAMHCTLQIQIDPAMQHKAVSQVCSCTACNVLYPAELNRPANIRL